MLPLPLLNSKWLSF